MFVARVSRDNRRTFWLHAFCLLLWSVIHVCLFRSNHPFCRQDLLKKQERAPLLDKWSNVSFWFQLSTLCQMSSKANRCVTLSKSFLGHKWFWNVIPYPYLTPLNHSELFEVTFRNFNKSYDMTYVLIVDWFEVDVFLASLHQI